MSEIAIFFDFDGTLVDSRADLAAAVNDTRRDYSLASLSQEAVLAHVGHGAKYLLTQSIPEVTNEPDRMWEIFREHYRAHTLDQVTLYPTVRETLAKLCARGCRLGINTAKPSEATQALLDHLAIREFFGDAVIAGGDCDEMKPSAKPLFACAKKMNHCVTARDWMVGDHWTDLKCAANAGVKAAFCAFGFGRLEDARFDVRLEKMSDLISAID